MREMVAGGATAASGANVATAVDLDTASPATAPVEVGAEVRGSALSVPWFVPLWLSGALWNIARWGTSFISAYLVNQMTGSPRLVQLTGVAMWAPLLLGGVVGGMISDRFDRRRMVLGQFFVVIPCAFLLGFAEVGGWMHLWLLYPFLVMVGSGWVLDMTSRRAMVYDLVGPGRIDNAMGLESVSSAAGLALGTLLGGTIVEAIGEGAAFFGVGLLMCASFGLLWSVPRRALRTRTAAAGTSDPPLVALRQGFGLLRTHRALVSVLGVTAFVNFFYFSFTPLVQIIGKDLGVGPALVGVLASMVGFGMGIGSMYVARYRPARRGLAYVVGSFACMTLLIGFALSPWYGVSVVVLLAASVGTGLFGSTQSTLVMTAVPEEVRGRALGLLSTAIGMLPLGMLALGEVAQRVGAPAAIVSSMVVGLACMVVWQFVMPEARRLRA